jgi:diadenosine tetraphosphate (Ap4A) HIT family hydrolase
VPLIERERYRIIRAEEPDYPGFCRVIWREHVAEMSELAAPDQAELMHAVLAVEKALRALYRPDKINLASLGNMVPHLHWHIIARKQADRHFPAPVWAAPQREPSAIWPAVSDAALIEAIDRALAQR